MTPRAAPPTFERDQIRRYYDRHTPSFVRFGQGAGAIHRAVWGPGVGSREEAFHHVEDRIAGLIARASPAHAQPRVVDLGCGVGASLCYLAGRVPIHGTGVTLSPQQATMATARVAAAGLSDRVVCVEGDYTEVPTGAGDVDLVYAIESFVHGPSPGRFFEQCARVLRPGGVLVICDDFARDTDTPGAARAIARFRAGWHINTLIGSDELQAVAGAAGFQRESTVDLTPLLELGRVRDRVIALVAPLLGRLPIARDRFDHLLGGAALQTCLRRRWIGYDFVVFRRKVATTGRWSETSPWSGDDVSTTATDSRTSARPGS